MIRLLVTGSILFLNPMLASADTSGAAPLEEGTASAEEDSSLEISSKKASSSKKKRKSVKKPRSSPAPLDIHEENFKQDSSPSPRKSEGLPESMLSDKGAENLPKEARIHEAPDLHEPSKGGHFHEHDSTLLSKNPENLTAPLRPDEGVQRGVEEAQAEGALKSEGEPPKDGTFEGEKKQKSSRKKKSKEARKGPKENFSLQDLPGQGMEEVSLQREEGFKEDSLSPSAPPQPLVVGPDFKEDAKGSLSSKETSLEEKKIEGVPPLEKPKKGTQKPSKGAVSKEDLSQVTPLEDPDHPSDDPSSQSFLGKKLKEKIGKAFPWRKERPTLKDIILKCEELVKDLPPLQAIIEVLENLGLNHNEDLNRHLVENLKKLPKELEKKISVEKVSNFFLKFLEKAIRKSVHDFKVEQGVDVSSESEDPYAQDLFAISSDRIFGQENVYRGPKLYYSLEEETYAPPHAQRPGAASQPLRTRPLPQGTSSPAARVPLSASKAFSIPSKPSPQRLKKEKALLKKRELPRSASLSRSEAPVQKLPPDPWLSTFLPYWVRDLSEVRLDPAYSKGDYHSLTYILRQKAIYYLSYSPILLSLG